MSDRSNAQRLLTSQAETLLVALTVQQYTLPHTPTKRALASVARQEALCSQAVDRALSWLDIDGTKSLGRLRRTELVQLARCLQRFSRHLMLSPRTDVAARQQAVATA